jgi:Flp pilus assembly protein TadD
MLGRALLLMNESARALDVIAPALRGATPDPAFFEIAGEAHARAGDYHKAAEWFERASRLQPDNVASRETHAMLQLLSAKSKKSFKGESA